MDACTCGGPLTFDPNHAGTTVGGLDVRGAYLCGACGRAFVGSGTTEATDHAWTLTGSGRSVDAGGTRIRCEGRAADPEGLMARIVRVPELERALRRIAAGETPAAEIAAAALKGAP